MDTMTTASTPPRTEMDERAAEIAHDVYARARGNVRTHPLPEHLALAWDDLSDEHRWLLTKIARAGFEQGRIR
jgi:hypothetical protein